VCVVDVVRGSFRLERKGKDGWVSAVRNMFATGERGGNRGEKIWEECIKQDLKLWGLTKEVALDRDAWRGLSFGNRPTRAAMKSLLVFTIRPKKAL